MKPVILYNSRIPKALSLFIDISGITLYPFIIYRNAKESVKQETHTHELIHIRQQKELWVIGFYVLYVFYWLKNKSKGQSNLAAYANIPFEVEAYTNQHNLIYLHNRPSHKWRSYVGKKLIG